MGVGAGLGVLVQPQGCLLGGHEGGLAAWAHMGNPWEFMRPSRASDCFTVSVECLYNSGK